VNAVREGVSCIVWLDGLRPMSMRVACLGLQLLAASYARGCKLDELITPTLRIGSGRGSAATSNK